MKRHHVMLAVCLLLAASVATATETPWGADYFPNVPLVTHEGKTVHFFDDLIEGKVVAVNFIYTICPDSCPLETARLAEVQRILGDRVGQDVFMYSISIDPENDTPEVLARYRERYQVGPGWLFLTGKEADITLLREKLGLYIEEIQDGSNNHNLNLIIGNQATGQWMKRSPFENPYVLATHIGSWLTGWKAPPVDERGYASAPRVRNISQGEHLFRTRCAACHTIGQGEEGLAPGLVGPDLLDIVERRDRAWLERWVAEPDVMLEEGDPIALGLYAKYDEVPMPNMRLSPVDVEDVMRYLVSESNRVKMQRARDRMATRRARRGGGDATGDIRLASAPVDTPSDDAAVTPGSYTDAVAIMNAWIREAHPDATANGGYMTLVNVGPEDLVLEGLDSPAFASVALHEMAMDGGLMKMRAVPELVIPAGGMARLEPGGRHLMLEQPDRHLEAGEAVDLTLRFRGGKRQTVTVKVADK